MPAEWIGFIGAVVGGLIGGLFTFLGVKLTIRYEKQKAIEEAEKKAWERKPMLRVATKNCGQFDTFENGSSSCDVLILRILKANAGEDYVTCKYDPRAQDPKNLNCVEYELENVGDTGIADICFVSDSPFEFAFCPLSCGERLIKNEDYQFSVTIRKMFILPGEKIKIRFYYLRENGPIPLPKAVTFVIDENSNFWRQEFWTASGDLMQPYLSSYEELKRYTNKDAAIAGFRDPFYR